MSITPGEVVELRPLVRRILCDNPSVFTGPGTNTYLVGGRGGDLAVIDPGPEDDVHLDRVAEAGEGRIRWILVTHTHTDHSPGAAGLQQRTGAEMIGFDERDGFVPDRIARDGFSLGASGFDLTGLHTPGHASNHLCYLLADERVLFSGDHIMSGSTVVIGPPDGDMAAYLAALRRLRDVEMELIAPGHGERIDDPYGKVEEYLSHRLAREAAILTAMRTLGPSTITEIVVAVYVDVPEQLHPIARHSVWAHLRKLHAEGRVVSRDPDDIDSPWSLVENRLGG